MKKLIEKWFGISHERDILQRLLSERTQRITELVSELSKANKKISEYGVRIANQSEIIFDLKSELKNAKQKYSELAMRENRRADRLRRFRGECRGSATKQNQKLKDASGVAQKIK